MNEKLFLKHKGKEIASSMKTNNFVQWTVASLKYQKENKTEQKLCLITTNTVTIQRYQISIAPLRAFNQAINNNMQPDALIETEENPFLAIEQPDLVLIPTLQKLGSRVPDGSTMRPRWSNCNIEKKHDHWLCKGIRLHEKGPSRAT